MPVRVYTPDEFTQDNPPALDLHDARVLAEGDSWFTLGTLNLFQATNLLNTLVFQRSVGVVNCAYPGHTLRHMADDAAAGGAFDRLLRQPGFAGPWDAVLLSAGGNDLIDAAQLRPVGPDGQPAPLADRLLRTPAEADPAVSGPARFLSEPGWARLGGYLRANLERLVAMRDAGPNAGIPLCLHTYAVPTVWRCGTVGATDGWLWPSFEAFGIPEAERAGVTTELFERLRALWRRADAASGHPDALPAVHVFDSATQVPLLPPDPARTRGPSGDWINEIHPSARGYRKLGRGFGAFVEKQWEQAG